MRPGDVLRLPIKHGEGLYVAPEAELRQMEERGQVVLRYVDKDGRESDDANLNGSMHAIAGVANQRFNVFGLMPHPEHAVEPMLGGTDGLKIFQSIVESLS
jgi:phosphoribosylformylglycinamidine synthase